MIEKFKKYKLILIPIIIIVLILSLIVIYFATKSTQPLIVEDQNIINLYKPGSVIIDPQELAVGKNILKDMQSQESVKKTGAIETIRLEGKDFQIVGFSNIAGGDEYWAGTCVHTKSFSNFIRYDGLYYKLNLNNLYVIFNPQTKEDYVKMLNIFYSYIQMSCGIHILMYDGQKIYQSNEINNSCNLGKIDVGLQFNKSNNKTQFIFFVENIEYPLTLKKAVFEIENNNITTKDETLFTCNVGVQY